MARRPGQEHAGPPRQIHLLRVRERAAKPPGAVSRRARLQGRGLDRLRDGGRSAAQRDQPHLERPRRHPGHDVLGHEHHRVQQRRAGRPHRRGAGP
ncbi:hypothetical protein G6F55_014415 [Rhizopus delemar]|nr:hypothetical protein G6F55_014415 [Rhizopus delemar]